MPRVGSRRLSADRLKSPELLVLDRSLPQHYALFPVGGFFTIKNSDCFQCTNMSLCRFRDISPVCYNKYNFKENLDDIVTRSEKRKAKKRHAAAGAANTGTTEPDKKSRKSGQSRRPADSAYLEKAALFYLQRFATSRAHLATVLARKVERRGLPEGTSKAEADTWIQAVVERMAELGYVDDEVYARARARTLLNRGKPQRVVRRALADKGIAEPLIDTVMTEMAEEMAAPDLCAAIRYVRRRRLGPARPPHRRPEAGTEDGHRQFQKDLAAMARAGFSYDTAKTVLDLDGEEGLDELERTAGDAGGTLV